MRMGIGWVCGAGALAVSLAGCSMFGGKPEAPGTKAKHKEMASSVGGPAPMSYTAADNGLPAGRIWKSQMALGDVNGDGLDDIGVVSRLADGPWIFVGDGKGNWKDFANGLPREPFCGGGMSFMDVNKDGFMDVAIADHCKGVYVFLGDGKGNWRTASSGLPTIGSEDVSLGDFNNDGCPDIASVAAAEEGVRAFVGNCKGVWKESSKGLSLTEWGNAVELKDINADGNLDIVAAYSAGPRAWLGDGKGGWSEGSQGLPAPEIHGLYWGIDAGDVNGDGKLDIISGSQMPPLPEGCGPGGPVCSGGGVEVFLQQADGTWVAANDGLVPMNALGVAFGDLDKDGKTDAVAVGKRSLDEIGGVYGVYVYMGDGTGKWTSVVPAGLPQTGKERSWGVGIGNIDDDGYGDIAVAFGDVVSPSWHSGPMKPNEQPQGSKAPQRGKFGSIGVWRGGPAE